jgi:hypothetical protein
MRSQQGELFQSTKQPNFFIRLLVGCTKVVRNVLGIFTVSPLTIISLAALFFFIWVSDQGQDLLLVINDFHFGPVAMYIVITILAMMNWHFPKFFTNHEWGNQRFTDLFRLPFNYDEAVRNANRGKIDVPRLLGVLTFFIPAFGMLRVRDIFGIYTLSNITPVALLFIATLLIQLLFSANFFIAFFNRFRKLYWFSCITLLLVPFLLWPFNQSGPQDIIYLFWGLLGYGLLFALITSNRIAVGKTLFLLNDTFITPLIWTCTILPVLLFLFYCVANMFFYQVPDSRFLTLAVVLSGIIFYYILFTILTVAGKVHTINFSLLLILLMTSITFWAPNNFHDITTVQNRTPGTPPARDLDTYIKDWLNDRMEPSTQSKYPIYIVNSYGGGIRAAAWASLCINRLDSLQYQKNKELFQDHVLAYSGASGGTVGLSVMCANRVFTDTPLPTSTFTRFYCSDFLTPVLTGLIGNDIWYSCWGIARFGDRSTVQERLWEHQYSTGFGWSGYAMPVTEIWDNDGTTVPLLFSNTTDVRFGRKGIYAPIVLDSTDFPGSTIVGAKLAPSYTLKLSTAAFLSARFPFLSPAGRIKDEHYFLDGVSLKTQGPKQRCRFTGFCSALSTTIPFIAVVSKFMSYPSETPMNQKTPPRRRRQQPWHSLWLLWLQP